MTYCEVKFNDEMYEQGEGPDYDQSKWLQVKEKLDLSLPNLPYYIDKDIKITESSAIMRYICRKYKPELLGQTDQERSVVDMMEGVV